MRRILASLAILIGAVSTAHGDAQSDANADAGRDKAKVCSACHGPTGQSPAPLFPHLAGQHESYLAQQIMDIRDGKRQVPQMAAMVAGFSDQDAWNVAAFFASQELPQGEASPNPEQLERGQELYRAGDIEQGIPACTSCHGPSGTGIASAGYPALSGQYSDYIVTSLKAYAAGTRDNSIMADVATKLGESDMQAVANYIQGLR